MIRAVEALLIRDWSACGLPGSAPARLDGLQLCSTWLADSGRVVFLFFRPGSGRPHAVARIVRSEAHAALLVREHENLLEIRAENAALCDSIPRPLWCGQLEGKTVRIETGLDGVPLANLVSGGKGEALRRTVSSSYASLAAWLDWFGHPEGGPQRDVHVNVVDRLRSSLDTFAGHFALGTVERDLLRSLRPWIDSGTLQHLPVVPNHGDLAAGAILIRRNGVGVVDWEYYRRDGLPLFDHLMAVIQSGFSLARSGPVLTLMDQFSSLFGRTWHARFAADWLIAACERFGLPRAILPLWLPIFLVEMSNGRDTVQDASARHSEGSWRELFAYYADHRSECSLTADTA